MAIITIRQNGDHRHPDLGRRPVDELVEAGLLFPCQCSTGIYRVIAFINR
jgi:hypothetical protein